MFRQQIILSIFFIISLNGLSQITYKDSSFQINSDTTFTIPVGGLLDRSNTVGNKVSYFWDLYRYNAPGFEPLKSFSLENNGAEKVDSIAIVFNNKGAWQTAYSIGSEAYSGYSSAKQRALGGWKFVVDNHVYFYKPESISSLECQDPVKFLTCYGYGDCFMINDALKMLNAVYNKDSLWLWGLNQGAHGIIECKIDSSYAVIDADQQAFYLKLDDETLASYDDIRMDPYLYIRTKRFPQANPYNSVKNYTDVENYLYPANDRAEFSEYGATDHSAYISLRPHEAISFYWDTATKFHQLTANNNGTLPSLNDILLFIGRGELNFSPDASQVRALIKQDGGQYNCIVKMNSPFVFTGGLLNTQITLPGHGNASCKISYSSDSIQWNDAATITQQRENNLSISLDSLIAPLQKNAVYTFYVKLSFENISSELVNTIISSLNIKADFQISKFFFPRLQRGNNTIAVSSAKDVSKNLALTINWDESNSNHPPSSISSPVFPVNNADVDSTFFSFKWMPSQDVDGDSISDYQFQLSDDSLMRFPLAPNYDVYVSAYDSTLQSQFKSAIKDFIKPGKTYYWHVRALDSRGAWSAWSSIWKFIPHGPLPPQNLQYDTTQNGFVLSWSPPKDGNKVSAYKIMANNTRGFFPTDATIIATTADTVFNITSPTVKYKFYRVAAIDNLNDQSTASEYISVPDSLALTYGGTYQLDSLSATGYQLSYTISDTSLISIDAKKILHAKKAGTLFINMQFINDRNEIIKSEKQLVVVNKAALKVIADSLVKEYGEENPALTYHIEGLIEGDKMNDIDKLPLLKTDAAKQSPAGIYEIIPYGADDDKYTFEYIPATLTIEPESALILPNPSNGLFKIVFKDVYINKKLVIINSSGAILMQQEINQLTMIFNLSEFSSGIYYLKILDDQGKQITGTKKFILLK